MSNTIFIILLAIQLALLAASICVGHSSVLQLNKVMDLLRFIPDAYDTPCKYYARIRVVSVYVIAQYEAKDGTAWIFTVKEFAFDPNDSEDMNYAYREALELIEHLN